MCCARWSTPRASSSGPGSLYTSVLPNLLVEGVAATIYGVNAVRIYVANLMTEPGETDGYTLDDHLRVIRIPHRLRSLRLHSGESATDRRGRGAPVCRTGIRRRSSPTAFLAHAGKRAGRRVRSGNRVGRDQDSASSAFAGARHSGVDQSRTINTAGLIPDGNVAGDRSRSVRGFFSGKAFRLARRAIRRRRARTRRVRWVELASCNP